jgi:hypothetical protein
VSSHPTSKARRKRQKIKRRYARLREDLQLSGDLPATLQGALRPEAVDPALQGCQLFPALVRQALREGWATPDSAKAKVVAELLAEFEEGGDPAERVLLFRLLLLLDQTQWERDRLEENAVHPALRYSSSAGRTVAGSTPRPFTQQFGGGPKGDGIV